MMIISLHLSIAQKTHNLVETRVLMIMVLGPLGSRILPATMHSDQASTHNLGTMLEYALAGPCSRGAKGSAEDRHAHVSCPKRPHKHKDPTFWFQGPDKENCRNYGLQDCHVYVVWWAPILGGAGVWLSQRKYCPCTCERAEKVAQAQEGNPVSKRRKWQL